MSSVETYTVTVEGLTLSHLVWNRFHRPMPGLVERIYAEMPALSAPGPYLPVGTVVTVPIDDENREAVEVVVSLWD